MSREALASCRMALELIAEVSREETVRSLAAKALAVLGVTASPATAPRTSADRMRDLRERRRRDGQTVTGDVTGDAGGEGGGVSGDPIREGDLQPETTPLAGGSRGASDASDASQVTPRPSRTQGDGLEWLVPAWCEGMRLATGEAAWLSGAIASGAKRPLAVALEATAPAEGDRIGWARSAAREYVESNPGATYSPFAFVAWLGSKKPKRSVPKLEPVVDGPVQKAARRKRDEEYVRDRKEAVPMPKALLEAVGAK